MAGTIELDPSGTELRIRFDYDPYIVAVRSVECASPIV